MNQFYTVCLVTLAYATRLCAEEQFIISNQAADAITINNTVVAHSSGSSADNIHASMNDFLFVKSTPDGREIYGNAASLGSVACSTAPTADFRYSLTWTQHLDTAGGYNALSLSQMSVDWALLRQHINTNGGTSMYNGEGVLLPYDLYFRYELTRAGGDKTSLGSASVRVPITALSPRDEELCSNSGSIYAADGITLATGIENGMSAAQAVITPEQAILLEDGGTYTLTLTLDKVTKAGTDNVVELDTEHLTYFGNSVAHVWTYAAVGNIAFKGELTNTPEPTTPALTLAALLGVAFRRRRRA